MKAIRSVARSFMKGLIEGTAWLIMIFVVSATLHHNNETLRICLGVCSERAVGAASQNEI